MLLESGWPCGCNVTIHEALAIRRCCLMTPSCSTCLSDLHNPLPRLCCCCWHRVPLLLLPCQLLCCTRIPDDATHPLQALAALDAATFQVELGRFFPVLTRLMTCDYATPDVQRALSELFMAKVGPLLAAAPQG